MKNKLIFVLKTLLEISFPLTLAYILNEIRDEMNIYLSTIFEALTLFMFIILGLEWIRRYQTKNNRPKFESYIYLPAIFITFLLGLATIYQYDSM